MKQQRQHGITVLLTCMMALLVSAMSGNATAREIFSWTDENGVVHFDDMPPKGQKVQTIKLMDAHRPDTSNAYPGPGDTLTDAASDAVIKSDADAQETVPPLSIADAKREQMATHRAERREAQAEANRLCAKHRARLASVEPHRRVLYTDESGETVRMDDDKRIALVEESRDFLASNCD